MTYPKLPKSYKGRFPFKVCSTSFVYPDIWTKNVEMLAPFLDEIELLFFESNYEGALPSPQDIRKIGQLLQQHGTTCNIHLPLDISLGDRDKKKRIRAVETVEQILDLTAPLSPSTYTVHWTYEEEGRADRDVAAWQDRLRDSFQRIGKKTPPESFTVENLVDYPFDWADDAIQSTGVHVCMDIGHFVERGEEFARAFEKRCDRIDILHIYGVREDKDHQALDQLTPESRDDLIAILNNFSGIVSLEVFSFQNLLDSLHALELWGSRGGW